MRSPVLLALAAIAVAPWREAAAQTANVEICATEEEAGHRVDPSCGSRWAVMNVGSMVEFWEVHELEFFWDGACSEEYKFPRGIPISSEVNTALSLNGNIADNAWDNNLDTRFTSNCKSVLGGCVPYDSWVGKDIRDAPKWKPDEHRTYSSVYCMRIWQSPNLTRSTNSIALVVWVNNTIPPHVVATYDSLGGGQWHTRPAAEAGLWRLVNLDSTSRPWEVAEVRFYSDPFCVKQAQGGVTIASSTFYPEDCYDPRFGCPMGGCACDTFLPRNTYHGITLPGQPHPEALPSKWIANCDAFHGCDQQTQWLGIDFNEQPVMVKCIKIYQPTHEGYADGWGFPHYSGRLALMMWDGYFWQSYSVFNGLKPGVWNDTRPEPWTSWRLVNYDRVPLHWEILKLAFYEEVDCGRSYLDPDGLRGTEINSNTALIQSEQERECYLMKGSCGAHAFDRDQGDPGAGTAWQSECSPCGQREAWIGLRMPEPTMVRCVRFYQSGELEHRTEAVQLDVWTGEQWETRRFESGLSGGTWNYRPAPPLTGWRLVATTDTVDKWTLSGLTFYPDAYCSGLQVVATEIAVGNQRLYEARNAFDHDPDGMTEWIASCTPPRTGMQGCAANNVWIGLQSDGDPLDVKCLRLRQDRHRDKQAHSAALEKWDGMKWVLADTPHFLELSGGTWQTLPGARGSMWRLMTQAAESTFGVGVSELAFHRSASCDDAKIHVSFPNTAAISSGFASSREIQTVTGYTAHLTNMGEIGQASPDQAFDDDLGTFWCDLERVPAWLGVDLTTQVADVKCVKLALAPVKSLQASYAEVQGWDGNMWATQATFANTMLRILFPLPSSSGWQHRPALPKTMWRFENLQNIRTWQLHELELYEDIDCSEMYKLEPLRVSSSARSAANGVPAGGHELAMRVFDGDIASYWLSDCPPAGCLPGEAWVGTTYAQPKQVRCVRLFQTGRRSSQARSLKLSAWTGDGWATEQTYHGFGGDSWNQRPIAPDMLWRIVYQERREEDCASLPQRPPYHRAWGINELEFYGDDDCTIRLLGDPITSGSWEQGAVGRWSVIGPERAMDGHLHTYWAANCGAESNLDVATCEEGQEWIGLDFSVTQQRPMEVKCVRVHQSQNNGRECCDPADSYRLERWNGTDWSLATWRHIPQQKDGQPVIVDATFGAVGQCPPVLAVALPVAQQEDNLWATRKRQDSESCQMVLTKAVTLLTDSLCEKHASCMEAGYKTGQCCPMDPARAISRCCCDIGVTDEIFEDQLLTGVDRNPLQSELFPIIGIEYVIIRLMIVLPWVGILSIVILYFVASCPKPREDSRWLRSWEGLCGPMDRWMDRGTPLALCVKFVCRKGKNEKLGVLVLKRCGVLCFGFLMGGFVLWIFLALAISELLLKLMMVFTVIIRWAKSPYNPDEPVQKRRLMIVMAVPIGNTNNQQMGIKAPSIGKMLAGVAQALAMAVSYFIRCIFDIVILRFAMMNIGAVELNVSVPDIMNQVPDVGLKMDWLTQYVYEILRLAGIVFMTLFTKLFSGVPRCEGPVLVFSGWWLIFITAVLIRWLNYDYFGLLLSSKQTLMKTRPIFQKAIAVTATIGVQAIIFIFLQLNVLMFTRALDLVSLNPADGGVWMCPYGDEDQARILGRIFLVIMAIGATTVAFLCANGHFLGIRRITEDFGRKVGMDLTQLDPTSNDKYLRFGGILCMLPTTFGIWIDGWNVDGYLLKQRARVYSKELNYPEHCEHCGFAHVPYFEIMKATGLQLSLAYQMAPFGFGAIIGKGCEYLNNPPLYYHGNSLACLKAAPSLEEAKKDKEERVVNFRTAVSYHAGVAMAYCMDKVLPFLMSLTGLIIYVALLYFTYYINKDNLETMAKQMFTTLMFLVTFKAMFEVVIPLVILLILGAVILAKRKEVTDLATKHANKASKQLQDKLSQTTEAALPWPLIGQIVHGVWAGGCTAIYWMANRPDGVTRDVTSLFSSFVGIMFCELIVFVAFLMEQFPRSKLTCNLILTVYCVCGGLSMARLVGEPFPIAYRYVIAAACGLVLIMVTGLAFPPPTPDRERDGALKSHILPRLRLPRCLPGVYGTVAGIFAGAFPYPWIIDFFGWYVGLPMAGLIGSIVGIIYGISMDELVTRPPGQYAVAVATVTTILVGVFVHWVVGVALGTVLASLVGSYFENRQQKRLDKEIFEPPRLTSSKSVVRATASMAAMSDVPAYYRCLRDGMEVREDYFGDSEVVGTLDIDDLVLVVEVARVPGMEHWIEGRIEDPVPGWVVLLDLDNGYQWAQKVDPTIVRAETPTKGSDFGRGSDRGSARRRSDDGGSMLEDSRSSLRSAASPKALKENEAFESEAHSFQDDGGFGGSARGGGDGGYGVVVAGSPVPLSPISNAGSMQLQTAEAQAPRPGPKAKKFNLGIDRSKPGERTANANTLRAALPAPLTAPQPTAWSEDAPGRRSAEGGSTARSSGQQRMGSSQGGAPRAPERSTAHGVPVKPGTNWSTWRPT